MKNIRSTLPHFNPTLAQIKEYEKVGMFTVKLIAVLILEIILLIIIDAGTSSFDRMYTSPINWIICTFYSWLVIYIFFSKD